jgi:hypothetical protein
MNQFDEAKILVKLNEQIESSSKEFNIGYSPMDNNLEPGEYAEYGFMRGQQEMILELIEKRIISVHDLYKLYR